MIKNQKTSQQQLELLIDSIDGVVWGFDLERKQYTFISHQFDFLLPGLRLEALNNPNLDSRQMSSITDHLTSYLYKIDNNHLEQRTLFLLFKILSFVSSSCPQFQQDVKQ